MSSGTLIYPIVEKQTKSSKRCHVCSKKVGIDIYTCKCDTSLIFCNNHRFPFEHKCNVDHINNNQKILQKSNYKVVAEKFERI